MLVIHYLSISNKHIYEMFRLNKLLVAVEN